MGEAQLFESVVIHLTLSQTLYCVRLKSGATFFHAGKYMVMATGTLGPAALALHGLDLLPDTWEHFLSWLNRLKKENYDLYIIIFTAYYFGGLCITFVQAHPTVQILLQHKWLTASLMSHVVIGTWVLSGFVFSYMLLHS